MNEQIMVNVDGQYINASHYAAMTKVEAVQAMKRDNLSTNKEWSENAWKEARKALSTASGKSEEELEKQAMDTAEARLAEINRLRAISGEAPLVKGTWEAEQVVERIKDAVVAEGAQQKPVKDK